MEAVETGAAHAPTRRAILMLALRIVVSAVLLSLLLGNIDFSAVVPRHHHIEDLGWVAAAIATAAVGIVLSAWRWQRVIDAFGIHVSLRRLSHYYFAGQFVGNALPSTIGGDVVRIARSSKDLGSTETAFATVAIERLTGFLALPALSILGFVLDPGLLDSSTAWVALLIDGIALAALSAILFLAGHPRAAGRFRDNENWTRFLGAVHDGVTYLRRDREQLMGVLFTAFLYQASLIATVMLLSFALHTEVSIAALIAFVPAVAMVQVLPISVSGLGVRESTLVLLLAPFGVPHGRAVGLGLAWYATMLIVSLAGAPAFIVGNRAARQAVAVAVAPPGANPNPEPHPSSDPAGDRTE